MELLSWTRELLPRFNRVTGKSDPPPKEWYCECCQDYPEISESNFRYKLMC